MMKEYAPNTTWQDFHKFTMFYLFNSLEACEAALPTIREEAVEIKEKAEEIIVKIREKHGITPP